MPPKMFEPSSGLTIKTKKQGVLKMAELKSTIVVGKLILVGDDDGEVAYTVDYKYSICDLLKKFEDHRIKITIEELEDQEHD